METDSTVLLFKFELDGTKYALILNSEDDEFELDRFRVIKEGGISYHMINDKEPMFKPGVK